ncbi:MAG TPA: crotonase/enoyl-CoA hydratase family protein [Polyangiales bacterium]
MNERVSYEFEASIATITMDDGKANALSLSMQAELNAALDRAEADKAIVVLCGRVGVLCAGFDLKTLTAGGPDAVAMLMGGFKLSQRLLAFPTPVVIACGGHALAMGAFLLLSADLRIGTAGAFKLGANEVAIGLTMPHTAVEICRQRLAPAHFNRATINAEIYTPEHAVAAGFLDHVVAATHLRDTAHAAAAQLATLNLPAHAATKLRVRANTLQAMAVAMELDAAVFASTWNE